MEQNPTPQPVAKANFIERNVALAIVLSIVTCGIYGVYWFVKMTDESNMISDDNKTTSGVGAFLLVLVTCGIYGYYWQYKLGKKMYDGGKKYDVQISDNSVLYLVLNFFGLGLVSYAIAQSDLNKIARK